MNIEQKKHIKSEFEYLIDLVNQAKNNEDGSQMALTALTEQVQKVCERNIKRLGHE